MIARSLLDRVNGV